MTSLESTLQSVLLEFRTLGMVLIAMIAMALLISEGAKSKLSPGKILTVVGSGILAAGLFWVLPTIISYVQSDAEVVVPSSGLFR
ncbi:MAG: hypothetical protein HOQ24_03355 [Mycobacteriaceae bacterium]|nr:hypothetical protein [Mycobacteriaceae bacterium]